jgi:hypothetical protein
VPEASAVELRYNVVFIQAAYARVSQVPVLSGIVCKLLPIVVRYAFFVWWVLRILYWHVYILFNLIVCLYFTMLYSLRYIV